MSDNVSEILGTASVTVSLCGKSYKWREPVRRTARGMVRDVVAIQRKYPSLGQKQAVPDAAEGLEACDACLDFLYTWHEGMKADKTTLDNATEKEIADAFGAVLEFITRPFRSATEATPEA